MAIGDEFIVYRANQYVVKARVNDFDEDAVVADTIDNTWNAGGAEVSVGDLAQNQF